MLMSEKRTNELVALAEGMSANPCPDRAAKTNLGDEVMNIVLAVAATVLRTACRTRQIQAMQWLADELEEDDEGSLVKEKGSEGVAKLRVFWWIPGGRSVGKKFGGSLPTRAWRRQSCATSLRFLLRRIHARKRLPTHGRSHRAKSVNGTSLCAKAQPIP
jgi:hypothetical protein